MNSAGEHAPAAKEAPKRSSVGEAGDAASDSEPTAPAALSDPATVESKDNGDSNNLAKSAIDGDSEAETLIVSPEKKRSILDNAPKLEPMNGAHRDGSSSHRASTTDESPRLRKRKLAGGDGPDRASSRASSRHSSPLSSPVLHALDNNDSHSDTEIKAHNSEPKAKRRRPSDILPYGRSKRQNRSIDLTSATERRETRSATYPRHSSEDRSVSPEPLSRREHRRGVSAQVTSIALTKKKRAAVPHINTSGRKQSSDPHSSSSDSSGSPAPSRPKLQKYASGDHDAMSPAKATGPRKILDKNGRTWLARACNNNDLNQVKAKYTERPGDLNLGDNAGNTPLQIAALEGFVDIVEYLLERKCDVDTRNIDKDTPLIDAVENGHVEVVRLLLKHGANPRLGNAKGDEPYELVEAGHENYSEIRKLLADARQKDNKHRRTDDQDDSHNRDGSSRAHSAASPRDSPPYILPRSPPAQTSRRKTGRSESTRNDLLWQANTQENLSRLAGKGDAMGVANILNILQKAETDSLIAAARAGHDEVLQYLLGMGSPEPDPDPVVTRKAGENTPMLAAIGRGNVAVIKLLVEQSGFNPTRTHKGKTYFEISEIRKGEEWEAEYSILKTAYERYTATKSKSKISPRKVQDKERTRQPRDSSSPVATKNLKSPSLSHKSLPNKSSDQLRDQLRENKRDGIALSRAIDKHKRRPTSDKPIITNSDQEAKELKKTHKTRRSQSDFSQLQLQLERDKNQKRRRLVTGKEHRRRNSFITDESSSEDTDRSRSKPNSKKEERPPLKRSRDSVSPERPRSGGSDSSRLTIKKRRTVPDSSPEEVRATLVKPVSRQPSTESSRAEAIQPVESKVSGEVGKNLKRPASSSEVKLVASPEDVKVKTDPEHTPDDMEISPPVQPPANLPKAETAVPIPEPMETESSLAEREAEARQKEEAALEKARQEAEEERLAAERRKVEEANIKRKAEEDAIAKKLEEDERQEKMRREAEERQRRAEERKQREFLEAERRRREALPSLLCKTALMLDLNDPVVRTHDWLRKFLPLFTVQTQQIQPDCPGDMRDELWIPSFQVAGLLATKDLNLRQYTSLDRRAVSPQEREALWKVSRNMISYDYHANAWNTTIEEAVERDRRSKPKFFAMEELFWVKLSDFQDQIYRHFHLAGLHLNQQRIGVHKIVMQAPSQLATPKIQSGSGGFSPYMSMAGQTNGILPNGTQGPNGYVSH